MEEILKECQEAVDAACKKYNYNSEDREGNDSLRTVLLNATYAMVKDARPEERELFYKMLINTPIIIVENATPERIEELNQQYIGNPNPHIIEQETELSEYEKTNAEGAYVSECILDENLQVVGKKSYIYIQEAKGKVKEFFGTSIHVSHLIHGLGHAWHAEKNQYIMQEDGKLRERIGTAEYVYSYVQREDGKYIRRCEKQTGIMIEEGMNTIDEENAMAYYMGLPIDEMKGRYFEPPLVPSTYQGFISEFVIYMLQKLGQKDFKRWRLYGDIESKSKIEALMMKTKYWKKRETDILSGSKSKRCYDIKRDVIFRTKSEKLKKLIELYKDIYYPDISKMTPLEKIDNVLTQYYNLGIQRMSFGNMYLDFMNCLGYEGYSLINQTADLKAKQEIRNSVKKEALSKFKILENAISQAMQTKKTKERIRGQS